MIFIQKYWISTLIYADKIKEHAYINLNHLWVESCQVRVLFVKRKSISSLVQIQDPWYYKWCYFGMGNFLFFKTLGYAGWSWDIKEFVLIIQTWKNSLYWTFNWFDAYRLIIQRSSWFLKYLRMIYHLTWFWLFRILAQDSYALCWTESLWMWCCKSCYLK